MKISHNSWMVIDLDLAAKVGVNGLAPWPNWRLNTNGSEGWSPKDDV
jgi:hypothetical protein